MGTTPRVTVAIPSWNGLAHLDECFDSLRGQTFADFRVVLVDNASTDGSPAWTRENYPEVEVVEMPRNGGFSYAVNEGIRRSDSEYVALLNNDTRADPRWLEELVAALAQHREYEIAASLMLTYYQPDVVNAAGDIYSVTQLKGLNRGACEPAAKYLQAVRVLGACAGAAIYRRSVFAEVGLFDEDFFLMHEDTDWNLRALIAGKRCLYVPEARVWHKWAVTTKKRPAEEILRLSSRNMGIVVGKDLPLPLILLALTLRPWQLFRETIPLRPANWHRIPMLIRARVRWTGFDFWKGFVIGLRKRPAVWRRRRAGWLEILRWLLEGTGPA